MRSYSVDKPIIIKAHAVKYFTNLASHQPFQNRTIHRKSPTLLPFNERFADFASALSLALHHHPCLMNALPVSHPHYPSPCTTTLASLVKGEVLSPERIRATTGGIAFLPHPFRFSDTSVNNPSVTVTENTILCQRIFNFYKKQY